MKPPYEVRSLPMSRILPGDNDRTVFADGDLRELADSLDADGLAQPIIVRRLGGEVYEIVAGERRFRAAQLLGWTEIPAIVRDLTDEQASRIMLIENIHRSDIDPLDEANAYQKRMERFGWSAAKAARMAKVSEKRVNARLSLLQVVPEVQAMIRLRQIGVQFGELMAPLDVNRQRIAFRYLATTEKPLLREFRAIVGQLAAEQAQDALFNTDLFIVKAIEGHEADRQAQLQRRFPVDDRLPIMKRVGTIGLSFETYIAKLMTSDDPHWRKAAPIVGRIYEAMLAGGMAFPPRNGSPLYPQGDQALTPTLSTQTGPNGHYNVSHADQGTQNGTTLHSKQIHSRRSDQRPTEGNTARQ